MRRPLHIGLLALACIATIPSAAVARSIFDGTWSLLIITRSGACDPTVRSRVQIVDSYITSEGGGFNLRGRVSPRGTVQAVISAGDQSASGSGRLTRTSGGGVWRGQGRRGTCAGTWQAERRE
jgi:hypothetical protein